MEYIACSTPAGLCRRREDSSGRCKVFVSSDEFEDALAGLVVAEGLAWGVVEIFGDGVEVGRRVDVQVGAFGELSA